MPLNIDFFFGHFPYLGSAHQIIIHITRSLVWFINDELRSVGRGARGAVTFPRLLSWQPVWTHPGAQGPSDINLIKLYRQ